MKILVLIFLSLVVSCSKKSSETPTQLRLLSSAITAGLSSSGGAIIMGKSTDGNAFQLGLQVGTESTDVALSAGTWEFAAITWENENGNGPLTGKNRCALTTATVEGEEVVIDLNLNPATCSDTFFSRPENLVINQFNKLRLVACSNLHSNTVINDTSNCSDNPFNQGNALSYRIVFKGMNMKDGSNLSNLASACITDADLTKSFYETNYRLPLNLNGNFPFLINTYDGMNCELDDLESSLLFQGSLVPNISQSESLFFTGPSAGQSSLFIPDNYIGVGGNTFANSGMLPPAQNIDYRYDDPTDSSGSGDNYDNTRKLFNDIVGTSNLTTPWALGAKASVVIYDAAPDKIITIESNSISSAYNYLTFEFFNAGSECLVTTSYDSGLKAFTLNYCTETTPGVLTTTDAVILSLSEAMTTEGLMSEFTITNGRVAGNISGSIQSVAMLMNGQDPEDLWKRNSGVYGEIASAYHGHLGAMLYKVGYETCSEIPTTGSQIYDVGDDGAVELRFSTGKIPMSEWMTSFGSAENPNIFEKRIGFFEKGQLKEFYEFNCSGNVYAGYYRSDDIDEDDNRSEVYYDAQNSDSLKIEYTNYSHQNYSGLESKRKQWSYLESDNTAQNVKLRTVRYYNDITGASEYGDVYASQITSTNIYTSAKHFLDTEFDTVAIDFEMGLDTSEKYNYDGTVAGVAGFQDPFYITPSTLAMNDYQFPKLMDAIPNHLPPMSMDDPRLISGFGPNITYQIYSRTMNFFDDWEESFSGASGCFSDVAYAHNFVLGNATSFFPSSNNYVYANDLGSIYTYASSFIETEGCTGVTWDTNFSDIIIDPLSIKNYDQSAATSLESLDEGTIFDFSVTAKILGTSQTFTNTLVTTNELLGSGENGGSLRLFGDQIYAPLILDPLPPVTNGSSTDFTLLVSGVYPGATLNMSGPGAPNCAFDDTSHTSITCTSVAAATSGDTWVLDVENTDLGLTATESTTVVP